MGKRRNTLDSFTTAEGVVVSFAALTDEWGALLNFDGPTGNSVCVPLSASDIGNLAALIDSMREAAMQAALERNRRETKASIEAQLKAIKGGA